LIQTSIHLAMNPPQFRPCAVKVFVKSMGVGGMSERSCVVRGSSKN
jgi:hypothetical protein